MGVARHSDIEQTLIVRAIAGDQTALERLLLARYDGLRVRLDRHLPHEMRRTISPEDVLQEVFLLVFVNIHRFRPDRDGAFDRWLSRVATRKLVSMIREARAGKRGGGRQEQRPAPSERSRSGLNLLDLVATYDRTASQSAADHEALQALHDAMETLPDRYRQVLELRYMQEMDVAETAVIMGCTGRAVEMATRRAINRLREVIGERSDLIHG